MRVGVFWIGKTRLPGVAQLTEEYAQRLGRYCDFKGEAVRTRNNSAKTEQAVRTLSANSYRVALDPAGQQLQSPQFAKLLRKLRDEGRSDVAFCVGAADGFSQQFTSSADLLLSLSSLTMAHEVARIVLLEQLYRAFTLLSNHPYPR
jgi:23S rRNA (pseudouridine1915-N3)-methyltransferase